MLSLELYSEPLFIVLMLGTVLAALTYRDEPRIRWALLAGGLAGLATLTRQNGVLLLLVLLWALWLPPRRRWSAATAPLATETYSIRPLLSIRALNPLTGRGEPRVT